MAKAHYRLLSPAGDASEEGSADVVVKGGAFVLSPAAGQVLRVPFRQIAAIGEGAPFTLRVSLAQGTVVELSQMGAMRTQILAELRDGVGDAAAKSASVTGTADTFNGISGGNQVELRIYDDAMLMIGPAGSERISFAFVKDVRTVNYVVTIEVSGREPVELTRLGNRTREFSDAFAKRLSDARGRTSAFLGSLLPGLDPMALRQAAGLLRDGVAVPVATLNGIHPELAGTLIAVAVLPERQQAIDELGRRGELAIGFRQIASVHKDAVGTTPWQDHSATPNIGGHQSPGGSFAPGFGGMMAAGLMSGMFGPGGPLYGPASFGGGLGGGGLGGGGLGGGGFGGGGFGPGGFGGGGYGPGGYGSGGYGGYGGQFGYGAGYGAYGNYWAYQALGSGMNSQQQHRPMMQRPDMTRGRLTPATEDLAALTTSGDDPTVLAFTLVSIKDRVVFEVLNLAEPATLVFRAAGPDAFEVINRALVDTGFAELPAPGTSLTAPARAAGQSTVLSDLLVGQVPHDDQWSRQLGALLPR